MSVNVFLPQVTRIPISGPQPYNTLVCVEAAGFGGIVVKEGKLYSNIPGIAVTPFKLAGFDQRVPPVFDQSTTAWISTIGPFSNGNWLVAVDSITGTGFDPITGQYFVRYNYGLLPTEAAPGTCMAFGTGGGICFYYFTVKVTSYVLCWEPEPVHQKNSHNRLVQEFFHPDRKMLSLATLPAQIADKLGVSVASLGDENEKKCKC